MKLRTNILFIYKLLYIETIKSILFIYKYILYENIQTIKNI